MLLAAFVLTQTTVEDGGVGDPQALMPLHPEFRVYDRGVVGADLAGADRVVVGSRTPGDEVAQACLVLDVFTREHFAGTHLEKALALSSRAFPMPNRSRRTSESSPR